MSYVDAIAAAVPTANRDAYREHVELMSKVLRENGALGVVDVWGDDVADGKVTSFPLAVQRKPDETVVMTWVTWPSRAARDKAMKAVMGDPRVAPDKHPLPFDGKRMIFGGFEVISGG